MFGLLPGLRPGLLLRSLPLLCLAAATLTPVAAHADTLLDFTFYLGGYIDPGTPIADVPPPTPGDGIYQVVRFTLPASPNVPPVTLCTGEFCSYPNLGFTVPDVPITIQDYIPTVTPPVATTADLFFGYGETYIIANNGFAFSAHDFPGYTLSPALEPTFILNTPSGSVIDFFNAASPVAFATIIPEAAGTSPVPEPATLTLLATGTLGLLTAVRRHRSANRVGAATRTGCYTGQGRSSPHPRPTLSDPAVFL